MMEENQDRHDAADPAEPIARKRLMGLLARASTETLAAFLNALDAQPDIQPVRGPETGLVMVRGRIGGGGDPFNLGEATVSRATVRLTSGEIGHGQMLGTDREKARHAAIIDALHQLPDHKAGIDRLLNDIEVRLSADDRLRDAETAATRVDFFTMVRGDD